MKQKTINTDKSTLLVVEIPEYYRVYHRANGTIFCSNVRNKNAKPVWDSFEGNWQLLGRLPDITEEQASKIVDRESKPTYTYEMEYPEYVCDEWWYRDYQCTDEDYMFSNYTAVESLYSFLQSNEVWFENPVDMDIECDHISYKAWQEVQSKVWDKEQTYLFIKED